MTSRARLSDLKTLWQQQQEARAHALSPTPLPQGEKGGETKHLPLSTDITKNKLPPAFGGSPLLKKGKTGAKRETDIDFQRRMRDDEVAPLPPPRRAALEMPRPAPVPKQRLRDEIEVLALAKYGDSPSPMTWDIGQELEDDQTFLRAGLSPDILRKLRRGQWAIQSELDLHGMIVDEAHDALVDFLVEARSRGLRCVRIIHGKGLTSPDKTPVLKGKVRRWLALWGDVLAYCEPAHHAGGGGAVVALLRGR